MKIEFELNDELVRGRTEEATLKSVCYALGRGAKNSDAVGNSATARWLNDFADQAKAELERRFPTPKPIVLGSVVSIAFNHERAEGLRPHERGIVVAINDGVALVKRDGPAPWGINQTHCAKNLDRLKVIA